MIEAETIIDGRYRVLSRLGSGGMAEVYLAEDQLLGRQVAVKVLHHHFAEDQEFVERFRREASSAAALSHQNIVGIFDRGEWNGTYYIAMEYVAGQSLKSIVREGGALDPAVAIDIVVQILRAAEFAHRLDHGNGPVPLPRAGAGTCGQRRLGPVLGRGHPLRAADGCRAVRGRDRGGDRLQAGL